MRKHRGIRQWMVLALAVSTTLGTVGQVQAGSRKSAPSGSGWSAATAISAINQPDPTRGSQVNDVAVNADGLAIAAWDQFSYAPGGPYVIGAAVQSRGKWGVPFVISGTTGFSSNPRVAVGADGTMAVSWVYEDAALLRQTMQVAVRPAGSTAWIVSDLATGPVGGVSVMLFVPVAIDATGNVTAAWALWDGARHVVQAATLPKGGSWSAPVSLSGMDDGLFIDLAVNVRGDAAVVYSLSPYSSAYTGTWAAVVSRSGPAGSWTAPAAVSETISSSVGYVTGPRIGLDASGLATVLYQGYGVEAVRQRADGTWTVPRTVLLAPNQASSYIGADLAVDGTGNAVAAASIFDATIGVDRASVWVATGTPDGGWTLQRRLTDPAGPVDAYAARVALSPDGALAFVGWIDHYHGTVQASRWINGAWSAADTIGRGTAFSSFQEALALDAASGGVARAIWKSAKSGTQTMAADFAK